MFLTATNLPHYLLNRGSLRASDLLDGDVVIVEAQRRNRNFKVSRGTAPGLFVKQVQFVHAETTGSVYREAAVLRLAAEHEAFRPLSALTATMVDYDQRRNALTATLFDRSENLNEFHGRVRVFPIDIARKTGVAIATYHAAAAAIASDAVAASFPRKPHWVFAVPHTTEPMASMSGGIAQLTTALRAMPDVCAALAAMQTAWEYSALIHGDVKWDNLLLTGDENDRELRIVDWELADVGDPAWDVASALASYLQWWLLNIPVNPAQPDPAMMIPHAPYALPSMWPAIGALWSAYAERLELDPAGSERLFRRVVRFAGARFVLNAFELLQMQTAMTPHATLALRLGQMLLCSPDQAAVHALGFASAAGRVATAGVA